MAKIYVSVATCERTLRKLIRNYPLLSENARKKDALEKHMQMNQALSLLVELAVLGVKYKNENNCVLRSSLKLEEE